MSTSLLSKTAGRTELRNEEDQETDSRSPKEMRVADRKRDRGAAHTV
jgi:hypothetical protein